MSDATDAFLLNHLPAIARVKGRPTASIQNWLGSGTFVPREEPTAKLLHLERTDWDSVMEAMAADVDRLSRAGRETLQIVQCVSGMPKATAWMKIQAYYASFYYAQAMMRSCGIVPSYYSYQELSPLRQILQIYSVNCPFSLKGQLLLTLQSSSKSIEITKSDHTSHEAAWFEFERLLTRLRHSVPNSTFTASEQMDILSDVDVLLKAVQGSTSVYNRLSSIRNDIQYRQQLGGWAPYSDAIQSNEIKRRIDSSITSRISLQDYEITHHLTSIMFLECCLCICRAARNFLSTVNNRYKPCFLTAGYNKMELQYAA